MFINFPKMARKLTKQAPLSVRYPPAQMTLAGIQDHCCLQTFWSTTDTPTTLRSSTPLPASATPHPATWHIWFGWRFILGGGSRMRCIVPPTGTLWDSWRHKTRMWKWTVSEHGFTFHQASVKQSLEVGADESFKWKLILHYNSFESAVSWLEIQGNLYFAFLSAISDIYSHRKKQAKLKFI